MWFDKNFNAKTDKGELENLQKFDLIPSLCLKLTKEQIKEFEKEDLIKFQINSYNYLLEKGLQEVIDEKDDIIVDVEGYNLEFGKIKVNYLKRV